MKDLGFARVIVYDPATHHKFSPNDNEFHGRAKQKWNNLIEDHSDDVKSSICLLYCLDAANANVEKDFQRNLQLGVSGAIEPGVKALFNGSEYSNFKFHRECYVEYKTSVGESVPNTMLNLSNGLDCILDGPSWSY